MGGWVHGRPRWDQGESKECWCSWIAPALGLLLASVWIELAASGGCLVGWSRHHARTTSLSLKCDVSLITVLIIARATIPYTWWMGLQISARFTQSGHLPECTFCQVDKPKALHTFVECNDVSGANTASGKVEGMRGSKARKSRVAWI
jgi:hypothetical protein